MKLLTHENVVRLHEVINDLSSDRLYMVQEYAENGPVMTEAEYNTPLHPELCRAYFRCAPPITHPPLAYPSTGKSFTVTPTFPFSFIRQTLIHPHRPPPCGRLAQRCPTWS